MIKLGELTDFQTLKRKFGAVYRFQIEIQHWTIFFDHPKTSMECMHCKVIFPANNASLLLRHYQVNRTNSCQYSKQFQTFILIYFFSWISKIYNDIKLEMLQIKLLFLPTVNGQTDQSGRRHSTGRHKTRRHQVSSTYSWLIAKIKSKYKFRFIIPDYLT